MLINKQVKHHTFKIHSAISKNLHITWQNQKNGGLRHDGQHRRAGAWSRGRQRPVLACWVTMASDRSRTCRRRQVRPGLASGVQERGASSNDGRPSAVGADGWGSVTLRARSGGAANSSRRRVPSASAIRGGARI
jgi:hypothetical protein